MSHSLDALMAHHELLDALLLGHQEALVGLEVARAGEELRRYETALHAHMAFEEARLLPAYSALLYPRLAASLSAEAARELVTTAPVPGRLLEPSS